MSSKYNDIITSYLAKAEKYVWIFCLTQSTDVTTSSPVTQNKLIWSLVPIEDFVEDEFIQLEDGSKCNYVIRQELKYEEALWMYMVLKTGKLEHSMTSFVNIARFLAEPFPINPHTSTRMLMNKNFFIESLHKTFYPPTGSTMSQKELINKTFNVITCNTGRPSEYTTFIIYVGIIRTEIYLGNDNNIYGQVAKLFSLVPPHRSVIGTATIPNNCSLIVFTHSEQSSMDNINFYQLIDQLIRMVGKST